jgi:hypothetical protein
LYEATQAQRTGKSVSGARRALRRAHDAAAPRFAPRFS